MNEQKNWPYVIAIAVAICILPMFPSVFGLLLGIAATLFFAGLLVAGFFFGFQSLGDLGAKPPLWIVGVLFVFCLCFFPSGIGVFLGVAIVGAFGVVIFIVLESFND